MVTYIVVSRDKVKSVHSSLANAKKAAKAAAIKTGFGHRISKEVAMAVGGSLKGKLKNL